MAVLAILLGLGAIVFVESTPGEERDSRQMDRGISHLVRGLASGDRADFIQAQKTFLDVNSGWIVDKYAVFAIQATERLRKRVSGPDEGESLDTDDTAPYYTEIAAGDFDRARELAITAAQRGNADSNQRSKYMLRFVSDIERVGGEDVVERIRGR